jgi:hypothetical protein
MTVVDVGCGPGPRSSAHPDASVFPDTHYAGREVPEKTTLASAVNKAQEMGRRRCGGVRYSTASGVESRPTISLRREWRPKRAMRPRAALS